jgi:hypothetical protein
MYKIFQVVKKPIRFFKDYGTVILLITAIVVIIYLCKTL